MTGTGNADDAVHDDGSLTVVGAEAVVLSRCHLGQVVGTHANNGRLQEQRDLGIIIRGGRRASAAKGCGLRGVRCQSSPLTRGRRIVVVIVVVVIV